MQKKTKRIIILAILLLITIAIILILTKNTNKPIPQPLTEQAKAQYETIIGDQTYDITNAVLEPNEIIPTISAGMIPIKWNGTNWIITNREDEDWYDYTNGQPAYIMLNDGTYQSEIIQDMTNKKLAENNVGVGVPDDPQTQGTIYMWIPRFAYNAQGEILYIKQGYSVAGTYTIPEIFTYETEKRDLSLAGIWVEYNPLTNSKAVDAKINDMKGPENKYGFIANTIGTNANNETTYQITIETYINALSMQTNKTDANDVGVDASVDPQINGPTNTNRTILKITNSNQLEPIKGKAYYDETEEKIKIEVTYNTNKITKILDRNGKELPINSTTADSGNEIIGNGIYKYIVIDSEGNIKEITTKVEGLKIYVIPDLETLKEFRDEVNAGNQFNGIRVIQTADISMNKGKYEINEETGEITFAEDAEQWEPIANYSVTKKYFYGDYDGQGHTISGIYINSKLQYQGLFGYCPSGTIKNLNIDNSKIISTGNYVGGIAGYANNVENCSNSAEISGNSDVGGIAGYVIGNISNCYNTGEILATEYYIGGIVGCGKNISNCYNIGQISSTNHSVGGICGYISNQYAEIKNCYNLGDINGDKCYVAGIVGEVFELKSIANCYNVGNITSKDVQVAGIVGYSHTIRTIDKCFNLGKVIGNGSSAGIIGSIYSSSLTISNCYNSGEITVTNDYCGGILANSSSTVKIISCYNLGNIQGTRYIGGIAGQNKYNTTGGTSKHIAIGNSYNFGNITGNTYIGGCSGYYQGNTVSIFSNNYNMGSLNGNSNVGGIIGSKTGSKNASDCYYETGTAEYGIGSPKSDSGCDTATREEIILQIEELEEYKKDEYNINSGLPIFSWQTDNDKLNLINEDNAFVEDTNTINNGYPILAWQVEQSE